MITPENERIHSYRHRQFNNFVQLTMPFLAGYVDTRDFEISLVDEYNQQIPFREPFDLVALTVNTPNAVHCYEIAQHFQQQGSYVVAGGPHVTLLPQEAQAHFDTIILGEAEQTWPRFLSDFLHSRLRPLYQSSHPVLLTALPSPRRDLIGKRRFTAGSAIATRGCRYGCAYCCLKQIYHASFRTRPIREVVNDLRCIRSKYFVFWDDNFFSNPTHAKALLTAMIPLKKRWAAQVTLADCQDKELLTLARRSGCVYLFVGLESFSEQGLASVNKTINQTDRYGTLIDKIHRQGICVQAGIMFGFDTDDVTVFAKKLRRSQDIGLDGATVSILTPLPGTPLYHQMQQQGRLLTHDWTYYDGKTAVTYLPKHMSPQELFAGYMWFRQQFYSLRSIMKRLAVSRTHLWHNMLVNLGYRFSINTSFSHLPVTSETLRDPRKKRRHGADLTASAVLQPGA